MTLPAQPFAVDQAVKPTKELLEHYPLWKGHDRPCKIASIKPSLNNKGVFQGWDIAIVFEGDTASRFMVCQQHLQPA